MKKYEVIISGNDVWKDSKGWYIKHLMDFPFTVEAENRIAAKAKAFEAFYAKVRKPNGQPLRYEHQNLNVESIHEI